MDILSADGLAASQSWLETEEVEEVEVWDEANAAGATFEKNPNLERKEVGGDEACVVGTAKGEGTLLNADSRL